MGYRSDTAYAIVFTSHEDKTKIIDKLTPEQWELIKGELTIEPERIMYHDPSVKWYSSSGLLGLIPGGGGFEHIDAHVELLRAAEDAFNEWYESSGTEGVLSLGVFMRLGEDSDDFEKETWGIDEMPEGYPEWYDLVDERRELVVGWEK